MNDALVRPLRTSAVSCPKTESEGSENEDAYAWSSDFAGPGRSFVCAVADGASQSCHPGNWARLIAEKYTLSSLGDPLENLIQSYPELEDTWLRGLPPIPDKLRWLYEPARETGAHTTLIGVRIFQEGDETHYQAHAVGDSCLFHLRKGRLLKAFPIASPSDFNASPHLIPSKLKGDGIRAFFSSHWLQTHQDQFLKEDALILATDNLSKWLLEAENPVQRLLWTLLIEQKDFEILTRKKVKEREIEDDDLTALRVQWALP